MGKVIGMSDSGCCGMGSAVYGHVGHRDNARLRRVRRDGHLGKESKMTSEVVINSLSLAFLFRVSPLLLLLLCSLPFSFLFLSSLSSLFLLFLLLLLLLSLLTGAPYPAGAPYPGGAYPYAAGGAAIA
jgi:hypothetical protein